MIAGSAFGEQQRQPLRASRSNERALETSRRSPHPGAAYGLYLTERRTSMRPCAQAAITLAYENDLQKFRATLKDSKGNALQLAYFCA
jgi:hypothetical protein